MGLDRLPQKDWPDTPQMSRNPDTFRTVYRRIACPTMHSYLGISDTASASMLCLTTRHPRETDQRPSRWKADTIYDVSFPSESNADTYANGCFCFHTAPTGLDAPCKLRASDKPNRRIYDFFISQLRPPAAGT